jgi:hypothetical protein
MEKENKKKDILEMSFNEVMQKIRAINAPKTVLVDGQFPKMFVANGTKYVVMSPQDCFNIDKQMAYHNIKIAFDLNQSPTSIKQRFASTLDILIRLFDANDIERIKLRKKLLQDALNNMESFKGSLTSRYPAALYLCTIFIIREGENLSSNWTFEGAKLKIDDWLMENYNPFDFFGLALASSQESQQIIRENLEAI